MYLLIEVMRGIHDASRALLRLGQLAIVLMIAFALVFYVVGKLP